MRMVAGVVIALVVMVSPAFAQTPPPTSYTLLDTVKESLFGDVLKPFSTASSPFPTFVSFRSTRFYERRKQRDTSKS